MSHAVICCAKCRPGSVAIKPTSRGIVPVCVGCEDKKAHDIIGKEVKKIAKRRAKR